MIRVLLVGDQRLIMDGLCTILESADGIDVVATSKCGSAGVEAYAREGPDVCLVDLQMAHLPGIETMQRILQFEPDAKVAALTTLAKEELVTEVVRVGGKGFLLKDASSADLIAAVKSIHQGGEVLAPDAVGIVMGALRDRLRRPLGSKAAPGQVDSREWPDPSGFLELTEREQEVLLWVSEGLSNRSISERLHVTEGTIKNHVSSIARKLSLRSRSELTAFTWKHGLNALVAEAEIS